MKILKKSFREVNAAYFSFEHGQLTFHEGRTYTVMAVMRKKIDIYTILDFSFMMYIINRILILAFLFLSLCCFGQNKQFQEKFKEVYSIPFSDYCDTTETLFFAEGNVSKFPNEILKCKKLTSLHFSMVNFKEFPDEINTLSNLEELSISYSPLKKIPKTIGDLSKLKILWLLDNDITFLPKEISKLKMLEVLNLNGNPIKKLPEEIFQLQQLKKIYLGQWNGLSLFNPKEQEYIRQKLPNCEVTF